MTILNVAVTGVEVGFIGNGETLIAKVKQGESKIEVAFSGFGSFGTDAKISRFN